MNFQRATTIASTVTRIPEEEYVNPFVLKLDLEDPWERRKTYLMTLLVLPIRAVLMGLCLLVAWAFASIGLYGLTEKERRSVPIAGWRRPPSCRADQPSLAGPLDWHAPDDGSTLSVEHALERQTTFPVDPRRH